VPVSRASSDLGILGELAAASDLISRGFRVYGALSAQQHPDLVALDATGRALSVECRVLTATGGTKAGGLWKRKKRTDRCDVYAWVSRDLTRIEYEPALPEAA
jgi:hypothetical protein